MKTTLRRACNILALQLASRGFAIEATWSAATDVPVRSSGDTAAGAVGFTPNFAPAIGTQLTVVRNFGIAFTVCTFSNLAQGQVAMFSDGGAFFDLRAVGSCTDFGL